MPIRLILLFVLFAGETTIHAQDVFPRLENPKPHLIDKALLIGTSSVQMEDVFSTNWALHHGAHETVLPSFVAQSFSAMCIFNAGKSYVEHRLTIRHPILGRIVRSADIGGTGFFATRNWYEGEHVKESTFKLIGK